MIQENPDIRMKALMLRRWNLGVARFMTGKTHDWLIGQGCTLPELGGSRPNRETTDSDKIIASIIRKKEHWDTIAERA